MIRPAEPRDSGGIRALLTAAFPTSAEADLVERLSANGDALVSLVEERGAEVVGHVILSRMSVVGDGREYKALGLGPVAVAPPFQNAGIGSALIHGALAIARATGEEMVFVLGEPGYYGRFGFSASTAEPFDSPYAGPFLMAVQLRDSPLPASGKADYAPAFVAL